MADGHDDLVLALRDLGEQLEPAGGQADPVAAAVERIMAVEPASSPVRRWWTPGRGARSGPSGARRVVFVATVVLVVLGAILVASGPRGAVARWLGIGSVSVTYTREVPAAVGREFDLGTLVAPAEALDPAGRPVRTPAAAGAPARAFAGRPAGTVTLVWAPSADLPEVEDSGIGLLLSALPGPNAAGGVSKPIGPGTSVELVRVGDDAAYWIAGAPHEVRVTDADGRVVSDASRLAGNTLIWSDGRVTYRLESGLDRDAAIAMAESLRPLSPPGAATEPGR